MNKVILQLPGAVNTNTPSTNSALKRSMRFPLFLVSLYFCFFAEGFVSMAKAQNMVGGFYHSLFRCEDGTVNAWGSNSYCELGNGNNLDIGSPLQVLGLSDVISIGCGRSHSMALRSDSTLWVWGNNDYGQLGIGDQISTNSPIQVTGLSSVKAIDGSMHSIALKNDSTVWTWGYNAWGQIGNGTTSNTPTITPTQVEGLTAVIAVEAAFERSMALKNDSTVWAWGTGFYGALGNGFNIYLFTPTQVPGLTGVIEIASSDLASYALKADGSAWAWGYNE